MTIEADDLSTLVHGLTEAEVRDLVSDLPEPMVERLLGQTHDEDERPVPQSPAEQAIELDPQFVMRPHLQYLSDRITQAARDVENGESRRLIISMPPRMGKSTLCTLYTPIWTLRQHPEWDHMLISHEERLAVSWGRQIRRTVEHHPELNLSIAPDAGAAGEWETTKNGGVLSRSLRGSIVGRGARVMIIDDPIKDFLEAHSALQRQFVWDQWISVLYQRLEPPSLVIVVMTRWHEDDFAGRLVSSEYEGKPEDWEVIRLPAIAEAEDALDREEGEPLISPLIEETPKQALVRWEETKEAVGSYAFAAMYQQRPAPAKGAIFDTGWWRYWTTDPGKATEDGRVVLIDPHVLVGAPDARWVDSLDCAFKGTDDSDYVVLQRWCKHKANRYLIAQDRQRRSFTSTLALMEEWADPLLGPVGTAATHEKLVEDKANGTAVIDTLKEKISGLIPVNPTDSKEGRARAVTPDAEAGNVLLPHPEEHPWVRDFIEEARNFPRGTHDDQVDGMTQFLNRVRDSAAGALHVPGASPSAGQRLADRRVSQVALSSAARRRVNRGPRTPR